MMEVPKMKRTRTRIEEEGTRMESLPREIIADILSRLPVTCLIKFQFVCKTWRALAHDSDLVHHDDDTSDNKADPCLVFHCDYPIRNQLCFVDLSSGHIDQSSSISTSYELERPIVRKFRMPFWDRMPEFDVVGSCNGLLCLADSLYRDAIFVYNPFTREFKELPKGVQYPEQEVVFGFGFHPETKQYKVVKIVYYRNGHSARAARRLTYPHSTVQVLTIGSSSSSWKTICKVPYQLVRRPSEALVNGRLHWVTRPRRYHPTRRIISFDLGSDQFQEVLKPDDCDALSRCNFHLVNLRGRLSAVVNCSHGKMEIWAMKEYGVKESWVKEASIGAYLFKGLKQNVDRSVKIWKNGAANGRVVRVLCVLRNGDILLEYKGRVLVSYDPKSRKFKDFMFQGMPNWFQTVVHSGTLNWVDTKLDD